MSANLIDRGFGVHGFDLDDGRVGRLVELGGTAVASVPELARAVDVLILSLPSEAALEAVAVAPQGVAAGAREGLLVIETSTLSIASKERARAALAEAGAVLLDCPLSGTGDQAVRRDVIVLASGDEEAVARCRPVFEGFARGHHYLGPFGNGSRMKFVANLLVAVHNVAAAEALNLARAAGLDLEQTLEVISDGAGTSRMLEVRGPKMLASDYESGVRVSVFQKDLALIAGFASAHGAPAPLLDRSAHLYEEAAAAGYADLDTASVYEVLRSAGSEPTAEDDRRGAA
jgi:3-hydroxyisobutyrate dehydrogenase-like beta-hydroxyacid dehydrogenase